MKNLVTNSNFHGQNLRLKLLTGTPGDSRGAFRVHLDSLEYVNMDALKTRF